MKQMPNLSAFRGTQNYWRLNPGSDVYLTDGVKYLTEELESHWLISAVEYFLTKKGTNINYPIEIKLNIKSNGDATLVLQNDLGKYGTRKFPSVNFPIEGINLIAYPYDRKWIIMLLSEY